MRDAPLPCLAYLVRHGATDSNLADPPILQGRSINGPLSETGRQQAQAAAAALAPVELAAVYCSPLLRAQETAAIIAESHGHPPCIVEDLTEVDVGDWERRSWSEIERSESAAYHAFQDDPATNGYAGGENLNQVRDRVIPTIQRLMDGHLGQEILIVAHNVVNRVALASAMQLPIGKARNLTQNNCGINTLRWNQETLKVVSLNEWAHLRSLGAPT